MNTPMVSSAARRVLLVELGGTASEVLVPLAEAGIMPNVARLLRSAALAQLRSSGPRGELAAWEALETGSGPGAHGMLDDRYLDHRKCRIRAGRPPAAPGVTMAELVRAADGRAAAVTLSDVPSGEGAAVPIWQGKPLQLEQLSQRIDQTEAAMRSVLAAARRADQSTPWRLLQVRLATLDSLLHSTWNLLGIGDSPGGNRQWIAKTQEAFRTLDDCLGGLLELAGRHEAAVVVVSPYGFGPSREKIVLPELLRRRELLHVGRPLATIGYRMSRLARKAREKLGTRGIGSQPIGGLTPVDWRRSRAVTLHGQSAALVYLNTPERFGTRALTTPQDRDRAAADVAAALTEARHPVSGEPLFEEVYLTEERFGCDPLARHWPEVVGIPAAGFCTRHRLDRNGRLVRHDPARTAARTGEGLLMVRAPGAVLGKPCTANVVDVAPTVLGMLGQPPGPQMNGRVLEELFAAGKSRRDRHRCRNAD